VIFLLLKNKNKGDIPMTHQHPHTPHPSETHSCSHHHGQKAAVTLSEEEKLVIRIEHLLTHNRQHEAVYDQLAQQVSAMGDQESSGHLRSASELTDAQNHALEQALASLKNRRSHGSEKAG
jgi:hypothetical protein